MVDQAMPSRRPGQRPGSKTVPRRRPRIPAALIHSQPIVSPTAVTTSLLHRNPVSLTPSMVQQAMQSGVSDPGRLIAIMQRSRQALHQLDFPRSQNQTPNFLAKGQRNTTKAEGQAHPTLPPLLSAPLPCAQHAVPHIRGGGFKKANPSTSLSQSPGVHQYSLASIERRPTHESFGDFGQPRLAFIAPSGRPEPSYPLLGDDDVFALKTDPSFMKDMQPAPFSQLPPLNRLDSEQNSAGSGLYEHSQDVPVDSIEVPDAPILHTNVIPRDHVIVNSEYEYPMRGPRYFPDTLPTLSMDDDRFSPDVSEVSTTVATAAPTEYDVPVKLHGVQKAMGDRDWSQYVKLMEKYVDGRMDDEDLERGEKTLFQVQDVRVMRQIRKMVNDMVADVRLQRVEMET